MIRLGGSVPTRSEDPREAARACKDFGYTSAICPETDLNSATYIKSIRDAFEKEDVLLAEVGCWCNLVAADEREREANVRYACDRLALADEVGALCCITFIGSVAPGAPHDPHPFNLQQEGFELAVETARKIIDAVKPKTAKFTLEMMQWVLPDSPEIYLDLIRAVDRRQFAAHLDPVNIILSPRQYFNSGDLIRKCVGLLGPWIVSAHAKDIVLENRLALHLDETLPGMGNLDYGTYLKELSKLPREVPLLLEHLETKEEYAAARDNIHEKAREAGVRLYGEKLGNR